MVPSLPALPSGEMVEGPAIRGRSMGFLIRIAFLLGLVVLFIPADDAEMKKLGPGQSFSLFDTFGFATAAYSDAEGFCTRNPQACTTGGSMVALFGAKARTGARWMTSFLEPKATSLAEPKATSPTEPTAPSAAQPVPAVVTGSVRPHAVPRDVSVSIAPRASANYLPLPPPRRPS